MPELEAGAFRPTVAWTSPSAWLLYEGHLTTACLRAGDGAPACPECLRAYLHRNRDRMLGLMAIDSPDRMAGLDV
jgi:hypothetical protein